MKNKKLLIVLLCIFPILVCLITGIIVYHNKISSPQYGSAKQITPYDFKSDDYCIIYSKRTASGGMVDAPYHEYSVYSSGKVTFTNNSCTDLTFYLSDEDFDTLKKWYKELCSSVAVVGDGGILDNHVSFNVHGEHNSIKSFTNNNSIVDHVHELIFSSAQVAMDVPYDFNDTNEVVMAYFTKADENGVYYEYDLFTSGTVYVYKEDELILNAQAVLSKDDLSKLESLYYELFATSEKFKNSDNDYTEDILYVWSKYDKLKVSRDSKIKEVYDILSKVYN